MSNTNNASKYLLLLAWDMRIIQVFMHFICITCITRTTRIIQIHSNNASQILGITPIHAS